MQLLIACHLLTILRLDCWTIMRTQNGLAVSKIIALNTVLLGWTVNLQTEYTEGSNINNTGRNSFFPSGNNYINLYPFSVILL